MPERIIPGTAEWLTFGFEHLQRYHFAARFCQGRRALDAGCGPGYGSEILFVSGASHVTGADYDEATVNEARRKYGRTGKIEFERANLEAPEHSPGQFDIIVAFEIWEHLRNPAAFLDAAFASLSAGGLLLISTPNRAQFSGHPTRPIANEFHVNEMDYAQARELLALRFHIVCEWEQSPSIAEYLSSQVALWQASWSYRLENRLRKLLGRPLLDKSTQFEPALESRAIVPLMPDRRDKCMQFIFLAERKE